MKKDFCEELMESMRQVVVADCAGVSELSCRGAHWNLLKMLGLEKALMLPEGQSSQRSQHVAGWNKCGLPPQLSTSVSVKTHMMTGMENLLFWKCNSPCGVRFFCLDGVAGEPSS